MPETRVITDLEILVDFCLEKILYIIMCQPVKKTFCQTRCQQLWCVGNGISTFIRRSLVRSDGRLVFLWIILLCHFSFPLFGYPVYSQELKRPRIAPAWAVEGNLFTNGDFSKPLSVGWTEKRYPGSTIFGDSTSQRFEGVNWARIDAGQQVLTVQHYGTSGIAVSQQVRVYSHELMFRINVKLLVKGEVSTNSMARVVLAYMDREGQILGRNVFLLSSGVSEVVSQKFRLKSLASDGKAKSLGEDITPTHAMAPNVLKRDQFQQERSLTRTTQKDVVEIGKYEIVEGKENHDFNIFSSPDEKLLSHEIADWSKPQTLTNTQLEKGINFLERLLARHNNWLLREKALPPGTFKNPMVIEGVIKKLERKLNDLESALRQKTATSTRPRYDQTVFAVPDTLAYLEKKEVPESSDVPLQSEKSIQLEQPAPKADSLWAYLRKHYDEPGPTLRYLFCPLDAWDGEEETNWMNWDVDVEDEFEKNLVGIDPSLLHYVGVYFYCASWLGIGESQQGHAQIKVGRVELEYKPEVLEN